MDHRGEFGYALWATMVNLAMGHRRAFGYVCTMGHCANLVIRYGTQRGIKP
jgi:hypothetical protein